MLLSINVSNLSRVANKVNALASKMAVAPEETAAGVKLCKEFLLSLDLATQAPAIEHVLLTPSEFGDISTALQTLETMYYG